MGDFKTEFMPLPTWLYVVGWIFSAYLFISLLGFSIEAPNSPILAGMYFVNFGVHEASHLIVPFLPTIAVAIAGSIGEVLFCLLLLFATLKTKAYFAAVFAGQWVMLGFLSAGQYMADARSQSLPLIGPGETVQHDWHYVFSQLGWLSSDMLIGGTVRGIGIAIGALCLAFGIYLIVRKLQGSDNYHSDAPIK